jgi:hypothetical protein
LCFRQYSIAAFIASSGPIVSGNAFDGAIELPQGIGLAEKSGKYAVLGLNISKNIIPCNATALRKSGITRRKTTTDHENQTPTLSKKFSHGGTEDTEFLYSPPCALNLTHNSMADYQSLGRIFTTKFTKDTKEER